jgi:outer membrane lipoprotein-sorting protein
LRKPLLLLVLPALLLAIVSGAHEPMQIKAQQKSYCSPADIFYAMAAVKSVHFTGWYIHPDSGERRYIEGWIKDRSKFRLREKDGPDTYWDGSRFVELHRENGFEHATIRPVMAASWCRQGQSYLKAFTRSSVLFTSLENGYTSLAECKPAKETYGSSAVVVRMDDYSYPIDVTIDTDSWLPLKWEEYDPDGRLVGVVGRFEYDMDIPDSVFRVKIPESMPVIDLTSQISTVKSQQAVGKKMSSLSGTKLVMNVAPENKGTTKLQPKLVFESLGPRGFTMLRLADGKTCRVVGKVYVSEQEHPWSGRVFEDEDIQLAMVLESIQERRGV